MKGVSYFEVNTILMQGCFWKLGQIYLIIFSKNQTLLKGNLSQGLKKLMNKKIMKIDYQKEKKNGHY